MVSVLEWVSLEWTDRVLRSHELNNGPLQYFLSIARKGDRNLKCERNERERETEEKKRDEEADKQPSGMNRNLDFYLFRSLASTSLHCHLSSERPHRPSTHIAQIPEYSSKTTIHASGSHVHVYFVYHYVATPVWSLLLSAGLLCPMHHSVR